MPERIVITGSPKDEIMNLIKRLIISKLFPGESVLKLVVTTTVIQLNDPLDLNEILELADLNSIDLNQIGMGDEIVICQGTYRKCFSKKERLNYLYPNIAMHISNKLYDERANSKGNSKKLKEAN